MDEMRAYIRKFESAYLRREQLEWSQSYMEGLLGVSSRKNIERMALELGKNVRSM